MPIHLGPGNRRAFLQSMGAGLAAAAVPVLGAASDGDLVYLLNDTHIGEKHPPNSAVPSNFREVVDELVGLKRSPAAVLINGDLALKDGQPGDYRHFARLISPLRKAGVSLHLTLGNHDHRETFYQVLAEEQRDDPPLEGRQFLSARFADEDDGDAGAGRSRAVAMAHHRAGCSPGSAGDHCDASQSTVGRGSESFPGRLDRFAGIVGRA